MRNELVCAVKENLDRFLVSDIQKAIVVDSEGLAEKLADWIQSNGVDLSETNLLTVITDMTDCEPFGSVAS